MNNLKRTGNKVLKPKKEVCTSLVGLQQQRAGSLAQASLGRCRITTNIETHGTVSARILKHIRQSSCKNPLKQPNNVPSVTLHQEVPKITGYL